MGRFKDYLEEMAQDAIKHGYQFHIVPNHYDGIHIVVATHPSVQNGGIWVNSDNAIHHALPPDVSQKVVGFAEIQHAPGKSKRPDAGSKSFRDRVHWVEVLPEHRRKGVGSGMYDKYKEFTGRPVKPSPDQTAEAKALWKDRRSIK